MARTYKPTIRRWKSCGGHSYQRCHTGWVRRLLNKTERQQVRAALHGELEDTDEASLEVLADLHEERGQLELAEQVRRGFDAVLPGRERAPNW